LSTRSNPFDFGLTNCGDLIKYFHEQPGGLGRLRPIFWSIIQFSE
jgi:hypothetical protein